MLSFSRPLSNFADFVTGSSRSIPPGGAAIRPGSFNLWPVCDDNLGMNIVSVTVLKEKLSYYLNLVKSGEEVVVTSHGHRVARIVPAAAPSREIAQPVRLVKELRKIKGVKLKRQVSGLKSLLEDRRRR